MKFLTNSIEDLPDIAKEITDSLKHSNIAAITGTMGVGKTTLIKEICKVLKVEDTVNSPSFSIVNEYLTENGDIIYHFDFYRLKNINELFDIGYEEYFNSGNICLIEWADIVEAYLPTDRLNINIYETENGERVINCEI